MEYERIHNTKMGAISPTKLRMKILGANNYRRKEGGSSSSRASPSKKEADNAKNILLAGDPYEEAETKDIAAVVEVNRAVGHCVPPKNTTFQAQQIGNVGSLPPPKQLEEDAGGGHDAPPHDNNNNNNGGGGPSGFEFYQAQQTTVGHFHRQISSKWNDAEKWLVNRQAVQHPPHALNRSNSQNHGSRSSAMASWVKVAPESMAAEQRHSVAMEAETKRIDPAHCASQSIAAEKFAFVTHYLSSNVGLGSAGGTSRSLDAPPPGRGDSACLASRHEPTIVKPPVSCAVVPAVQSVTLRDIGTEMTPIPSQEPSRTGTPLGATTPSMPSTPRRGAPARLSPDATTDDELDQQDRSQTPELSEMELRLKTRREIAALGIQLGKMNIASWASKDNVEHPSSFTTAPDTDQLARMEREARAVAWEEAEKSKQIARYRREEVKLQAWESHERARIEAAMRKAEAKAEQARGCAKEKTAEKLAALRRKADEKRAAVEARMSRRAARTAVEARGIRRTGRFPPSSHLLCCGCLFYGGTDL